MRSILCAALTALLPLPAAPSDQPAPSGKAEKVPALALTVRLDRESYKAGDRVELRFDLRNAGPDVLWIGDGWLAPVYHEVGPGRHWELNAADTDGVRLRYWSSMLTEGRASGVRHVFRLEPGKSYTGVVVLSEGSFATVATDRRHRLGLDGKRYTIALNYTMNDSFGVHNPPQDFVPRLLWKGVVVSNAVSLVFE
jgi:hypothetical protein